VVLEDAVPFFAGACESIRTIMTSRRAHCLAAQGSQKMGKTKWLCFWKLTQVFMSQALIIPTRKSRNPPIFGEKQGDECILA
jgi:hypothetical protein